LKASAREKKVLYAGIALAVVILIYYAATTFSTGDGESVADKITTQEGLLRRQRELLGYEEFHKKRIAEAENDLDRIQSRLLPGNNATVATTELQKILTDFAEQSGVVIQTRTPLQEKKVAESDSLTKISVRIGVDCMLDDLVEFMLAIKNYEKFLKIEEMLVNTVLQQRQMVIRRPLNMVVSGYISVPPPEPAAKNSEDAAQAASR